MKHLIEGEDYYMLPDGRLVFSAKYHLDRGYCCGKGCLNCPFEYVNVDDEMRRQRLLDKRKQNGEADR